MAVASSGTAYIMGTPAGLRTAKLAAAKPAMRMTTSATTAPKIAWPRPCRVVRALPSAAKAMASVASG